MNGWWKSADIQIVFVEGGKRALEIALIYMFDYIKYQL